MVLKLLLKLIPKSNPKRNELLQQANDLQTELLARHKAGELPQWTQGKVQEVQALMELQIFWAHFIAPFDAIHIREIPKAARKLRKRFWEMCDKHNITKASCQVVLKASFDQRLKAAEATFCEGEQ